MRKSTELLKSKIMKYIELCEREETATDNFNKSVYDMKAQELKEKLNSNIFSVDWRVFINLLKQSFKSNNVPYIIVSELGEEERDYLSEVDNRYLTVTNVRNKLSINYNRKVGFNTYFDTKAYYDDIVNAEYIGLLDLLTENGQLRELFKQAPYLIDDAFDAYEITDIQNAKLERARLRNKIRHERMDAKEKISYIKKLIKRYNQRIRGNYDIFDEEVKSDIQKY